MPAKQVVLESSLTHVKYKYQGDNSSINLVDFNNFAPGAIRKSGGVFLGSVQIKSLLNQIFYPTVADGIVSINLSFGSYFWLDLTESVAEFQIINIAPDVTTFTIAIKQNSQNIKTVNFNFSGAVLKWANNDDPDAVVPVFDSVDVFSFSTKNQGATWFAQILGQDFKSN